jgi:hypothetical protein
MWKLAQKSNEHVRHSKRGNILGDSSGMARANQTTIRPRKNTLYKRLRQFGVMLRRTDDPHADNGKAGSELKAKILVD